MRFSPPPPSPALPRAATRQRLLAAAGEVFAQTGYRAATVRRICQRARANVAAVNYHFGGKEQLYLAVLRESPRAVAGDPGGAAGGAAGRLRALIRALLRRLLGEGPQAWQEKLIALEMMDPTGALDTLVAERFQPMAAEWERVLRALLGAPASEELLRLCGCSIVGQCVFYHHCRSVVCRLFPEQHFGAGDLDRLADHITGFSLAALRQFARRTTPRRGGRAARRRRAGRGPNVDSIL